VARHGRLSASGGWVWESLIECTRSTRADKRPAAAGAGVGRTRKNRPRRSGRLRGAYPLAPDHAQDTSESSAGNALDVASLGVALMRGSGVPAQYASGTLSEGQAQQLILSMFPASYQTVGYIPPGTQVSDPADDAQLLTETESHSWFQFDAGSGMADAGPLMPGATVGQAFATSTGTFTEVSDSLRAKSEVSLTAEIYSQADAAFGLNPLQETVVLDQTFNDVELVGHPLTVGNFVSQSGIGATFSSVTHTYSPYLEVGDDAVTLAPGQVIDGGPGGVTLAVTETGNNLVAAGFNVTAIAESSGELKLNAPGTVAVRPAFVSVPEVDATPSFTQPGGPIDVSAKVLNAVNQQQQALASYTITDPNGNLVFASQPVPLTLTVQASLATVDLGSFDTTGLTPGGYAVTVTVTDTSGNPIPGASGQGGGRPSSARTPTDGGRGCLRSTLFVPSPRAGVSSLRRCLSCLPPAPL
jgi:hypothetical protein